jgi:hypothetical protein
LSPIEPFGWKNEGEPGAKELDAAELEAFNSHVGAFAETGAAEAETKATAAATTKANAAQANAEAASDPLGSAVTAEGKAIAAAATKANAAQAAAEAASIPLAQKGAASGVASLTAGSIGAQPPAHHAGTHAEGGSDPLTIADLPVSVVSGSAMIDLCRAYGAEPGKDITKALNEAIAAATTLGGGTIYFSKPGTYLIEGAVKEGTAFGYTYAGQVLFPARTVAEGMLAIRIMGLTPAAKQLLGSGTEGSEVPRGVKLKTTATSGNVFDCIPAYETGGTPFTSVCPIFGEGITIEAPENPQVGGINAQAAKQFEMDANLIAPFGALPTGNAIALSLPAVSNGGNIRVNGNISGWVNAVGLAEHAHFGSLFIGRCAKAFYCYGAGHANFFGYVSVEECPTVFYSPGTGKHGALIYGLIDHEDVVTGEYAPANFIEDEEGEIVGKIVVKYEAIEEQAGYPVLGGRHLDVVLLGGGSTVSNYTQEGWKSRLPVDNFLRSAVVAGNIGSATLTAHPWQVTAGSFGITNGASNGTLKSTNAAGESRALLPMPLIGTGARIIRATVTTGTTYEVGVMVAYYKGKFLWVRLHNGKVQIVGTGGGVVAEEAGVAASTTYELSIAVSYPRYAGAPVELNVFLGSTEVLKYKLTTAEQEALLAPAALLTVEDGIKINKDTGSAVTYFAVLEAANLEKGEKGATGEAGPSGPTAPATNGVIMPVRCGGNPVAANSTSWATANRAHFNRCIIPTTGHIKALHLEQDEKAEGNVLAAIFDVGEANAGFYTVLWEGVSVAMSGAFTWLPLGTPELACTANQEVMLAVMGSSTTATVGVTTSARGAALTQLPNSYMPVTGGANPKLTGKHTYGSFSFGGVGAKLSEAELETFVAAAIVIGRAG